MATKRVDLLEISDAPVLNKNTDVIKFEGTNTDFFWRIYGEVINPDCKLVVPPTHQAIYIKDGRLQNVLESGMYPIFETTKKGLFGHKKQVDATTLDIIFMNRTIKFQAFWGTANPIFSRDPLTDIPVTLRGNGEFEVGIDNPEKFYLEIVGTDLKFDLDSLRERLAVKMMSFVEPVIAQVMKENTLSYIDIALHKKEIGDMIQPVVNEMFIKDCGLKVFSFTIGVLQIADGEIRAIEDELAARRMELKEKLETKEIADRLERLEDKEFERALLLKLLEQADRDKYYEVLKVTQAREPAKEKGKGCFCPNCGHQYEKGAKFCLECGEKLPGWTVACPGCGKKLDSNAKFCPECGYKIGG